MNSADASQLRHFSRIPCLADIQLHLVASEQTGRMQDIALKGALVETAQLDPPSSSAGTEPR